MGGEQGNGPCKETKEQAQWTKKEGGRKGRKTKKEGVVVCHARAQGRNRLGQEKRGVTLGCIAQAHLGNK